MVVVIIKPWGIQSIKGRRSLRRGVSAEEVQLIAAKLRAFPPSTHSVQQCWGMRFCMAEWSVVLPLSPLS